MINACSRSWHLAGILRLVFLFFGRPERTQIRMADRMRGITKDARDYLVDGCSFPDT